MSSDDDYDDDNDDYYDDDDFSEDYHDYFPEGDEGGHASPTSYENYEDPDTFHTLYEEAQDYEREAPSAWVEFEGRHSFYEDEGHALYEDEIEDEGYVLENRHTFYEDQSVPASPEYYDEYSDSDGEWGPQIASPFQTRYNEISSPLLSHSPRTGEYVPPATRQSYYFPYGQTLPQHGGNMRSINLTSDSGRWLHWQRVDHNTGEVEVETARVGETLGQGTYGQVYDLDNHRRPLVAKRFFKPFSRATSTEIRNLADVGQLRGVAWDVDGAPIAIIHKQPGDKLRNLQRERDSEVARLNGPEYEKFLEKASEAVAKEVVEEAKRTGLRHTDAHPGNVLLEYDFRYNTRGTRVVDMKVDAALIDWGLADVVGRCQDWDRMYRRELRNARVKFGLERL